MINKQGLNSKEIITFQELLVKANDIQIRCMWLELQDHIKQRLENREGNIYDHDDEVYYNE